MKNIAELSAGDARALSLWRDVAEIQGSPEAKGNPKTRLLRKHFSRQMFRDGERSPLLVPYMSTPKQIYVRLANKCSPIAKPLTYSFAGTLESRLRCIFLRYEGIMLSAPLTAPGLHLRFVSYPDFHEVASLVNRVKFRASNLCREESRSRRENE